VIHRQDLSRVEDVIDNCVESLLGLGKAYNVELKKGVKKGKSVLDFLYDFEVDRSTKHFDDCNKLEPSEIYHPTFYLAKFNFIRQYGLLSQGCDDPAP